MACRLDGMKKPSRGARTGLVLDEPADGAGALSFGFLTVYCTAAFASLAS